jgi:hypothetical protein
MVSFAARTLQSFVDVLAVRSDKFALVLDESDAREVVQSCIRKLNDVVSFPRILRLDNPGRTPVLPDDVDTVVSVKFSNESLDMWFKEFGLLPLLTRSFPMGSLEAAGEFLILKGNINMLNRHLKLSPDYEHLPPNLVLNNEYHCVIVEYLPHLDPDIVTESWILNQTENTYILERAWCLFNQRNAEALMAASYIGVGTEYGTVLAHWTTKLTELDASFIASGVITYMG